MPEGEHLEVSASKEGDMLVYLRMQNEETPSWEIAGCPSCPPQGVSVVGFHHPYRRAWNRELAWLAPAAKNCSYLRGT